MSFHVRGVIADPLFSARLGFVLCSAASIAGNVLDTPHSPAGIAWGVMCPALLIITFEAIMRPSWPAGWVSFAVRVLSLGTVAGISAMVSYLHLSALILTLGEPSVVAHAGPVAIDAGMLACASALLVNAQARKRARRPAPTPRPIPVPERVTADRIDAVHAAPKPKRDGAVGRPAKVVTELDIRRGLEVWRKIAAETGGEVSMRKFEPAYRTAVGSIGGRFRADLYAAVAQRAAQLSTSDLDITTERRTRA